MPREELADVSTPYCFICLLHLANEHSLRLTSNGSMTDVAVETA
jgi:condensin complex subunit 2